MQKKYLILVIVLILLISGCINLAPERGTASVGSLYKGTKGLELSFVKNAPPKSVFEDTYFNVIMKIENKGAYDVGFGTEGKESEAKGIFVITPETGYVDLNEEENTKESYEDVKYEGKGKSGFKVRGRSLANPVGDEIIVYSNLKARKLGSLSKLHESSVFATVCYPYQTKLSASVCIDPDIYNLKPGEKACSVKDLVFSDQGAPVAITKIEVQMVSTENNRIKPKFLLHIENKGNGEVVKRENYIDACGAKISIPEETDQLNKYFNVINVEGKGTKLSDSDLKCKQGDNEEIVLSGKKGVISCEVKGNFDVEDAYIAPLSVVLDYGYTSTISKQFDIEKPK